MHLTLIALWLLVGLSPAWQAHASGEGSDRVTAEFLDEEEEESLRILLTRELSNRLGVQSDVRIERISREMGWIFVCGRPLAPGGGPMDYSKTLLQDRYSSSILDDYFCSLLRQADSGIELEELAVGDTDAPFIDWLGKHGVPASILDDR